MVLFKISIGLKMKRGAEEIERSDIEESLLKKDRVVPSFFVSEEEWQRAVHFLKRQFVSFWDTWHIRDALWSIPQSKVLKKDLKSGMPHKHINVDGRIITLANKQDPGYLLGKGGQGKVVLGRDENGKTVAVKIEKLTVDDLKDTLAQKVRALQSEELEQKILTHEHLLLGRLTVFPQLSNPKSKVIRKSYTVMEFIEGSDLKEIDAKNLTLIQRLIIAKLLCQGLKHIHAGRFIHCDIKPANIKVKIDGDQIMVRFMDFGISLELKEGEIQLNNIPASFGTGEYIAPEVSKGYSVGYVSDIYSLGVVFRKDLLIKGICDEMTSYTEDRRPSLDVIMSRLDAALEHSKSKKAILG